MRIGMMADVYKPHVSGVTHYISLNKRALERRGHEVYVFTFGDQDHPDEEGGVVLSPGVPLADTGYFLGFGYTKGAREKLETMDLIHVHHPFLSGRLALRYGRPAGIPIVFTNHTRYDLYAQAYLPMLPDQIGTTFLQTYLPPFCKEVDLVIAPSQGLKDVLRDLGVQAPIQVIPNGVDLEPFRDPSATLSREELNLPSDSILLIYTGRLGPEKNLSFLIRAFAGAQAAVPEARLILVGDGPERDNLEHLAQSSGLGKEVVFAGMVAYDEMPRYLAAADGFVTPSVTEVHPLSVIEALAAGLPVVGIQSPGVGDTIVDGENGLLSSEELAAFTAKLTRFLAEPDLRARLAARAPESARTYDIDRTCVLVEQQYERLVASPPHSHPRFLRNLWRRVVDQVT